MKNQYFNVDWVFGGKPEPISSDEFSDTLKSLRAGRDFIPGNPLALELFHDSAYDSASGKFVKPPAASCFFNTPRINKNGIITSTAAWPYATLKDFWEYFKNTEYRKFLDEHRSKGDFDSKFCSATDFQVIRVRFVNRFVQIGSSVIIRSVYLPVMTAPEPRSPEPR